MKEFKSMGLSISAITLILLCLPYFAQCDPIDPCVDPDLYCPIDNGLYLLLAIAIVYGIKKIKESKSIRHP